MKARVPALVLFFALLLTNTAYAQDMRLSNAQAILSFSGTTANCYVDISGRGSDKISATIKLCCGNQNIETWNESVTNGHLFFQDTASVTKGKTYELVVEYTVNGKVQQSLSDSGTC